jgi:hypothetical protein
VSSEGGTFLGYCRLWGRESWWIGTVLGVELGFMVAMCGEWIAIGLDLLVDS